jgi:hypothetical protein
LVKSGGPQAVLQLDVAEFGQQMTRIGAVAAVGDVKRAQVIRGSSIA